MIYIIHGTNTVQSRNFLFHLRNANKDAESRTYTVDRSFEFSKLKERVLTNALFEAKTLTILEFQQEPNIPIEQLDFLAKLDPSSVVIFWIGVSLKKTNVLIKYAQKNKNFAIRAFNKRERESLYKFIDFLNQKDKRALILLDKLVENDSDALLILSFMSRNFKTLLGCKLGSSFFERLHPYIQKKVKDAAENFMPTEIIRIYEKLYETDLKLKSKSISTKDELFTLVGFIINARLPRA